MRIFDEIPENDKLQFHTTLNTDVQTDTWILATIVYSRSFIVSVLIIDPSKSI